MDTGQTGAPGGRDAAFRRPGSSAGPAQPWLFGREDDAGQPTPRHGDWTTARAATHPPPEGDGGDWLRGPGPGVPVAGRLDSDGVDESAPGWFRIVGGAVILLVAALALGAMLSRPWTGDGPPGPLPTVTRR